MTQTTKNKTNEILEKIRQQYVKNQPKPKKEKISPEERANFLKRYFNTVEPGEYIFRILPTQDGTSPFVETYFHSMKVNGKFVKLYCSQKNDGKPCPLCEAEQALKDTGKQEDFVLSRNFQSSLFYIIKGIDRNKVEDGVKFWRFKHNYKQGGAFDKILPIFSKKGDITDPINGRDLIITATRTTGTNNITYTTVSSIMPDDASRLVEDDVLLKELVNDKLTWKDVYKPKDVEYLQKVVEGKAPYWDDNQKKYITPGGSTKKTIKAVPVDEDLNDNSEDNDVHEVKFEETKTKEVVSKASKKLKKQVVEDVFETETISDKEDGEDDDLPF